MLFLDIAESFCLSENFQSCPKQAIKNHFESDQELLATAAHDQKWFISKQISDIPGLGAICVQILYHICENVCQLIADI